MLAFAIEVKVPSARWCLGHDVGPFSCVHHSFGYHTKGSLLTIIAELGLQAVFLDTVIILTGIDQKSKIHVQAFMKSSWFELLVVEKQLMNKQGVLVHFL